MKRKKKLPPNQETYIYNSEIPKLYDPPTILAFTKEVYDRPNFYIFLVENLHPLYDINLTFGVNISVFTLIVGRSIKEILHRYKRSVTHNRVRLILYNSQI